MNLQNIFYTYPAAAYLLLLTLLWIVLYWLLLIYRRRSLSQLGDQQIQEKIVVQRDTVIFWVKVGAICLAWISLTLALMQPVSFGEYVEEAKEQGKTGSERRREPQAVLLVIDASASMEVTDMPSSGTRLEIAKEIADQFISSLEGESVALDAFTSIVSNLSPLTTDYLFVRLMLRELKINEGGIAGSDLLQTLEKLKSANQESIFKVPLSILLFTDGGDTELETLRGAEKERRFNEIVNAAKELSQDNVRVFTIGLGSLEGGDVPGLNYEGRQVHSKVNEEILRAISEAANGAYFASYKESTVDLAHELAALLNLEAKKKVDGSSADNLTRRFYFHFPLLFAILLLLGVLVFPDTFKRRTLSLLIWMTLTSHLFGEDEQMRSASAYVSVGEYSEAQDIYRGLLQGNLEPWERAVILYDMGTSLLKGQKWDQAIETLRVVPYSDYPNPLIGYRGRYNLALAYLGKASVSSSADATPLLQQAKALLPQLQQSYCALKQTEGVESCDVEQVLDSLARRVDEQLTIVASGGKIKVYPTFQDNAENLIQRVQQSIEHAKMTEGENKQMFLKEDSQAFPIFRWLERKITASDPYKSQRLNLLRSAKGHFLDGLYEFYHDDFNASLEAYREAEIALSSLLELPAPPEEAAEQKDESQTSAEQVESERSAQQSINVLLQMEQDDTASLKETPATKQVSKPW